MKILKGIILVFTKIFLIMSILLFLLSLSASYVLENGISNLLVGGLSNINTNIQYRQVEPINSIDEVELSGIYDEMLNEFGITEEQLVVILESPVVKELINEFIEIVSEDISTGDTSDFNLGTEILDFVQENKIEIEKLIDQPLPMEKIEEFANSEEVSNFNVEYKETINMVSNNVPSAFRNIIVILEKFISNDFRLGCLIISVGLIIIVALLQWSLYKWIRTLGNSILGCGIFTFIINLVGNTFSSIITSMLSINMTLQFGKSLISSGAAIGCGVILLIIYMLIKKYFNKEIDKEYAV